MKALVTSFTAILIFFIQVQAQPEIQNINQHINTGDTLTIAIDINTDHNPPNQPRVLNLADASPNPARGFTWIPYSLPSEINSAQIVVRNLLGSVVKTETIDSGSERVRIDTSSFNNGIYIYSLLINNQPVLSKRLVVAN
jgi:hypothetical protein